MSASERPGALMGHCRRASRSGSKGVNRAPNSISSTCLGARWSPHAPWDRGLARRLGSVPLADGARDDLAAPEAQVSRHLAAAGLAAPLSWPIEIDGGRRPVALRPRLSRGW